MTDPQPFKLVFSAELAQAIGNQLAVVYPRFAVEAFTSTITGQLDELELKDRVRCFAAAMRAYLPSDYEQALAILLTLLAPELSQESGPLTGSFWLMPVAQFVEDYGLDHPAVSLAALHQITQRFTGEYAIRPYLERYPELTLATLERWAHDANADVRRLVSEGTRPRLPWGRHLTAFIADPAPVLHLLEILQDDPSDMVRKSVANNLNDISKDWPEHTLDVCRRWWVGANDEKQRMIRHALRTLVKRGDPQALAILGHGTALLSVSQFTIEPDVLHLGGDLLLECDLVSQDDHEQSLVIDYVMHLVRARGLTQPKVFKWGIYRLAPGETLRLRKKQNLRPVTTRRYYSGRHRIELQINGRILAETGFELIVGDS